MQPRDQDSVIKLKRTMSIGFSFSLSKKPNKEIKVIHLKLAFDFSYSLFPFHFSLWSLHISEAVVLLVVYISFMSTFYFILGATPALLSFCC